MSGFLVEPGIVSLRIFKAEYISHGRKIPFFAEGKALTARRPYLLSNSRMAPLAPDVTRWA
jgi:hypothetical protein